MIATFIAGQSRADLDHDPKLLYALVRAIEVIGEAASRMSADGRSRMADVPWVAIIGMRNRLIHGYSDVDADIVWSTATDEIPALLPMLRSAADR